MHKLDKAAVPGPGCLAKYEAQNAGWDALTREDKALIRGQLELLQGPHCAYCESKAGAERHIEHFRPRNGPRGAPALTFSWSNLFLSCNNQNTCGKYKDSKAGKYSPEDLIDPGAEDPDEFLFFNLDGTVVVADNITSERERRAKETIRVFNLNQADLIKLRQSVLKHWREVFTALRDCAPDELNNCLKSLEESSQNGPFPTAIRHLWRGPRR